MPSPTLSEDLSPLLPQVLVSRITTAISDHHDEVFPEDELSLPENTGKKRRYSDAQPAETPGDCSGVEITDKRRKRDLASEQGWVDVEPPTASATQPDLQRSAASVLPPPPGNIGMSATASGVSFPPVYGHDQAGPFPCRWLLHQGSSAHYANPEDVYSFASTADYSGTELRSSGFDFEQWAAVNDLELPEASGSSGGETNSYHLSESSRNG